MSRIYERRGSLPPDPGRTGGRPKGPRRRWQRPDEPRPDGKRKAIVSADQAQQPSTDRGAA